MKIFILLAFIGYINCASVAERFIPFLSGDKHTDTSSDISADGNAGLIGASANPVVVHEGSGGKKITLTITKTIENGAGHGHGNAQGSHHAAPTSAAAPAHASHAASQSKQPSQGQTGQLHINFPDNSVKIGNSTLQSMIEGLLGGNIQNVKITHPEMIHGKKPVAVIFSSSIHVVDLGTLEPEVPVTPAPKPAHHDHHHHDHQQNITHPTHQLPNATSLLNTLLSPLMMLTHHQTPVAPVANVQTMPVQSMAMQPVIMMMPSTAMSMQSLPNTAAPMMIQPDQLQNMLNSLLSAKTQLLNPATLTHPVAGASGHPVAAASPHPTASASHHAPAATHHAVPTHGHAPAVSVAPVASTVVATPIRPVITKKITLNIEKQSRNGGEEPSADSSVTEATTKAQIEEASSTTTLTPPVV